jgi:hypothetical protein
LPTTATRSPAGSGWCDQLADVEHLVDVVDPDHPRLAEQRVDGGRRRPALPDQVTVRHRAGPPGLHDDDRLLPGQPAGDPGELAGVPDRLEVEQDGVGVPVVLPVLHQVVAADVDAVAGRHERRDPHAAPDHVVQQGHAQRAGLREEADPAARGQLRRQ